MVDVELASAVRDSSFLSLLPLIYTKEHSAMTDVSYLVVRLVQEFSLEPRDDRP